MIQMSDADCLTAAAFKEKVRLGLGWDFHPGKTVDLDASMIAFDRNNQPIDIIYFGKLKGCGGAVKHCGDNRTGVGEGDDEVIKVNLGKVPPNVFRLACIVNCYSKKKLSCAKSASVRLFMGSNTLGIQKLSKVIESYGLFFCFLQRGPTGSWFFRSVVAPISGSTARESIPEVRAILSTIPGFC